jgi:hypothetical protein
MTSTQNSRGSMPYTHTCSSTTPAMVRNTANTMTRTRLAWVHTAPTTHPIPKASLTHPYQTSSASSTNTTGPHAPALSLLPSTTSTCPQTTLSTCPTSHQPRAQFHFLFHALQCQHHQLCYPIPWPTPSMPTITSIRTVTKIVLYRLITDSTV